MIEPRVYRAALLPAVLAAILVMFSLESRPRPLPQGLAADVVFDGDQALTTLRSLERAGRDRRPGTAGNRAAGALVASGLTDLGFSVARDRFEVDDKQLVNVVGRRAGRSRREVVVVAARDAAGVPDAAVSGADTAALLEIGRVYAGRPSNKTIVLASVDGNGLGEEGTARLADRLGESDRVDAVLVLSGMGVPTSEAPELVAWSGDATRGGLGLQRTVAESLRQEVGDVAEGAGPAGQLARLTFPLGLGAQGVLLRRGYDAVRISGDGELPDGAGVEAEEVDRRRLEGLGRGALRSITALDAGPRPEHGPGTYVTAVSQVVPGWVLSLLSLTLILPVLVASIDAFARARRRRVAVRSWLAWVGAGFLALVTGLALVQMLTLGNAIPGPPEAPVDPGRYPLDLPAAAVLAGVGLVVALAWLGLRRLARASDPALADPQAPGSAVAASLVLSGAVLLLWALNPFAALLWAPALHLWLLSTLVDPLPPTRARWAMLLGGLLLPALVGRSTSSSCCRWTRSRALWYLVLLLAGGHVDALTVLVGAALTVGAGIGGVDRESRLTSAGGPRAVGSAIRARAFELRGPRLPRAARSRHSRAGEAPPALRPSWAER